MVQYVIPVEKEEKKEYNGLASDVSNTVENHPIPKLLGSINYNNYKEVIDCLQKNEEKIKNSDIENAIVITKEGEIYQCFGNNKNV